MMVRDSMSRTVIIESLATLLLWRTPSFPVAYLLSESDAFTVPIAQ